MGVRKKAITGVYSVFQGMPKQKLASNKNFKIYYSSI